MNEVFVDLDFVQLAAYSVPHRHPFPSPQPTGSHNHTPSAPPPHSFHNLEVWLHSAPPPPAVAAPWQPSAETLAAAPAAVVEA